MNSILTHIPTALIPLLFGVLAAIAGAVIGYGHGPRESVNLASKVLYAVAVGCVVISIAVWAMPN